MGLPDYSEGKGRYNDIYYFYDADTRIPSGEWEFFNYNGSGELIFCVWTIISATAQINNSDNFRMYIDGTMVCSEAIGDMLKYNSPESGSLIMPIGMRARHYAYMKLRSGIPFFSNLKLTYYKYNIADFTQTMRLSLGLY